MITKKKKSMRSLEENNKAMLVVKPKLLAN
jgi:hypothetical protein